MFTAAWGHEIVRRNTALSRLNVRLGYARVSTSENELFPQLSALEAFGCGRIYREMACGTKVQRSQLEAALDYCSRKATFRRLEA
jgi:hypothetical protein